jgi:hypothetical protein
LCLSLSHFLLFSLFVVLSIKISDAVKVPYHWAISLIFDQLLLSLILFLWISPVEWRLEN